MDIKQAEFSLSAPTVSMCPKDTKPEYAFIGRSNVGKSSLIICDPKVVRLISSLPNADKVIKQMSKFDEDDYKKKK